MAVQDHHISADGEELLDSVEIDTVTFNINVHHNLCESTRTLSLWTDCAGFRAITTGHLHIVYSHPHMKGGTKVFTPQGFVL